MKIPKVKCPSCGILLDYDPKVKFCPSCGIPLIFDENSKSVRPSDNPFYTILERLSLTNCGDVHFWTPIIRIPKYRPELQNLYVKLETLNYTGVFTDRGASVDVCVASSMGYRRVIVGGLGDFVISVIFFAKRLDLKIAAVVPSNIEIGKLHRIALSADRLHIVEEKQVISKVFEYATKYQSYPSIVFSPTVIEGYKSIAYEIAAEVRNIDAVLVPVGEGVLIMSLIFGFEDLVKLKYITRMPKIIGVRARYQDHLAEILREVIPTSEAVTQFLDKIVRDYGGEIIHVSQEEILNTVRDLARREGIAVEPPGALGLAGLDKALESGLIEKRRRVLALITGGPLRDLITLQRVVDYDLKGLKNFNFEHPRLGEVELRVMMALHEMKSASLHAIWKRMTVQGLNISHSTLHYHLTKLSRFGLVDKLKLDAGAVVYKLSDAGREFLARVLEWEEPQ